MTSSPESIPAIYQGDAAEAARAIAGFDKVLIATHVNPDGDAIGALAAMGHLFKALGREFVLYLPGGVPQYLEFVELPGPVYRNLDELPFAPQSAVYVDCSEPQRLGPELARQYVNWSSVNIDHHLCEEGLGSEANFIHTSAAAACQLVAYLVLALGMPPGGALGRAIGVGLLTDTGQFGHDNTSGDVFSLAALLEKNGVHFPDLGEKLRHAWTLRRLHIWGKCFQRIHLAGHGKIAWCLLTLEEIRHFGIGKDDMEGFGDVLRGIVGVQISIFAREQEEGGTRFSLRSKGEVNVQAIALALGGGGHRNASGITMPETGDDAMSKVLEACESYLAERDAAS